MLLWLFLKVSHLSEATHLLHEGLFICSEVIKPHSPVTQSWLGSIKESLKSTRGMILLFWVTMSLMELSQQKGNLMKLFIKGKNVIASSGFSGNPVLRTLSWWQNIQTGELMIHTNGTSGVSTHLWLMEVIEYMGRDQSWYKKTAEKTMCLGLNHHGTLANGEHRPAFEVLSDLWRDFWMSAADLWLQPNWWIF